MYWIGAAVVFLSFVVVNHESKGDEEAEGGTDSGSGGGYVPVSSGIDGEREEIELDDDDEMESRASDRESRRGSR